MARLSDGIRIRGNADEQMRKRQLLVGEPRSLGTKQHRGRTACAHVEDAHRSLVEIERPEILIARSRSGGGHESTVGDGLDDAADHAGAAQEIVGSRGPRDRVRVRKCLGTHQYQLRQRHVFHGARHRPDVSGV
jgi:hypothetical protein